MKFSCKLSLIILIFFLIYQSAFSAELPTGIKEVLKKKFVNIVFKIDNSFVVNNKDTYLPLIPQAIKNTNKIEIANSVQDTLNKNLPKLIELSNGWMFVKLIKQKDGSQTIIDLKEIPESIKNSLLNTKFPEDLVIPKDLVLKEELSALAGDLPVKIDRDLNGLLYLTSPDTGKIVYLDLSDASMIHNIQTKGWKSDNYRFKRNSWIIKRQLSQYKISRGFGYSERFCFKGRIICSGRRVANKNR